MSETVLFVHGAAGDARIWSPVIDALPKGIDGRALTLTYFGDAPWPDDGRNFGTQVHAADITAAARETGQPVHVVSWSYGVHPTLAALLDAPDLFSSALFYEAALPHYIERDAERRDYLKAWHALFGPVAKATRQSGAEAGLAALLGEAAQYIRPERLAIYRENARMMPLLFGGGQEPAAITPAELAVNSTPCCAALGKDTDPTFAIPTRALATAIPGAVLEELPGANHFLPELDPGRFAGLVEGWIASLPR